MELKPTSESFHARGLPPGTMAAFRLYCESGGYNMSRAVGELMRKACREQTVLPRAAYKKRGRR